MVSKLKGDKTMAETSITVFGDSIGKGVYTDNGKIEIIKNNAVELLLNNYGLNITNQSVYGLSLKRFTDRKIIDTYIENLPKDKDNIAVFELGGNDADYDWKEVCKSPDLPHGSKTDIKEFGDDLKEIVKKLNKANVKMYFCTLIPVSSERYFTNVISKIADCKKVLDFFNGDINTIHRHQEVFNSEILKVAITNGIDIIDLRTQFLLSNSFEDLMCLDGIHPNEKGQYLIYKTAKSFL